MKSDEKNLDIIDGASLSREHLARLVRLMQDESYLVYRINNGLIDELNARASPDGEVQKILTEWHGMMSKV